jgi:MFS family permease
VLSGLSRETRLLLLSVLIATTAQGMALPYLFIYLTHVRHLDPTWAGLIGGWVGLAGVLLAGPVGTLTDRFGSRTMYVATVVVYAGGIGSYAFVHSIWAGFLAATFASAGGAPLIGTYNTLLASAATGREQTRLFALGFAILNLGIGLGSVIGGLIGNEHHPSSFVLLYLVDAGGLIIGSVIILPLRGLGRPSPVSDAPDAGVGGYREVLADPLFRRFLIMGAVLLTVAYGQLEYGFPALAADVGGLSTRAIGVVFAVNCMTIVVIQVYVAKRIEGHRRSRLLAVVAVVIALSWAILALTSAGHHHSTTIPLVGAFVFAVVFAFGEVLMSPVLPALTNDLASDRLRGRYNALSSMTFSVTSVIGPIMAGPLIGTGHWPIWLGLVLAGGVVAATLSISLGRRLTPLQNGLVDPPVSVSGEPSIR